jgi:negative regulator of genetic competence, sporulation and motility
MPERDFFPPGTEEAFDTYLNQANTDKRYQLGLVKRAEYRHWLLHPDDKVKGATQKDRQQQYNQKNRTISKFELLRSQLWQKATESEPAKYIVCTYESFEQIKAVHVKLEHAGIDKTYGCIDEQYYGITKEEVAWLLARCIPC